MVRERGGDIQRYYRVLFFISSLYYVLVQAIFSHLTIISIELKCALGVAHFEIVVHLRRKQTISHRSEQLEVYVSSWLNAILLVVIL
jgi:hypothetical protein